MSLTRAQFERAEALERYQQKLVELSRMSSRALHALLEGDPREAADWVRCAAECGLSAAQVRLGRMLLEGAGMPRDEAAALQWFARAAAQQDPEAVNMVGRCYENGWGVPADLKQAAASYGASAEGGHDWGQYNFGNLLFDGRGVPPDRSEALRWYLRAASQGHARAMNLLARCLEEGWGCHRSLEEAVYWYGRSAAAGYFRAQFNYAALLAERGSLAAAGHWFAKAMAGGNADMHRAVAATLAHAVHPALRRVRARALELIAADAQATSVAGSAADTDAAPSSRRGTSTSHPRRRWMSG
jgi:hypothetical protein